MLVGTIDSILHVPMQNGTFTGEGRVVHRCQEHLGRGIDTFCADADGDERSLRIAAVDSAVVPKYVFFLVASPREGTVSFEGASEIPHSSPDEHLTSAALARDSLATISSSAHGGGSGSFFKLFEVAKTSSSVVVRGRNVSLPGIFMFGDVTPIRAVALGQSVFMVTPRMISRVPRPSQAGGSESDAQLSAADEFSCLYSSSDPIVGLIPVAADAALLVTMPRNNSVKGTVLGAQLLKHMLDEGMELLTPVASMECTMEAGGSPRAIVPSEAFVRGPLPGLQVTTPPADVAEIDGGQLDGASPDSPVVSEIPQEDRVPALSLSLSSPIPRQVREFMMGELDDKAMGSIRDVLCQRFAAELEDSGGQDVTLFDFTHPGSFGSFAEDRFYEFVSWVFAHPLIDPKKMTLTEAIDVLRAPPLPAPFKG